MRVHILSHMTKSPQCDNQINLNWLSWKIPQIQPNLTYLYSDTILWGPVASGILFRLNELGLWPNDLVRGHWHIWGQSTKVEVEIALQEELKVIYNRPKPHGTFVRGGLKHPYPLGYYFKGTLWQGVKYWIRDEGGG